MIRFKIVTDGFAELFQTFASRMPGHHLQSGMSIAPTDLGTKHTSFEGFHSDFGTGCGSVSVHSLRIKGGRFEDDAKVDGRVVAIDQSFQYEPCDSR